MLMLNTTFEFWVCFHTTLNSIDSFQLFLIACTELKELVDQIDRGIREWKDNEGLVDYNEMNDIFGELLQAKTESGIETLNADQIDIFYMGCYDVDSFRQNFLEGPNLDRYMEDPKVIDLISKDEKELLKYGMRWVKKKLFEGGCLACAGACSTQE